MFELDETHTWNRATGKGKYSTSFLQNKHYANFLILLRIQQNLQVQTATLEFVNNFNVALPLQCHNNKRELEYI